MTTKRKTTATAAGTTDFGPINTIALESMLDKAARTVMRETFFLLGVDLEDARSVAEFRDSLRKQRARK
jgi:hypothetical protein